MMASPTHARQVAAACGALLAVLVAFFAASCGIGFGEEATTTEIFKDVRIDGSLVTGKPVTIFVDYAQQYPVQLVVKCDLLSVEDVPTVTPLATGTVSPLAVQRTPEPTLPPIPRVRPTPRNKVMELFGTTLPPNKEGGPVGEATPVLDTIERRFLVPPPGDYTVWCYTPLDLNNGIFEDLTVPPQTEAES